MKKVFGIGNTILSDDGIGVRIVEEIQRRIKRSDILFYIVGIDYLDAIGNINNNDQIVVIDSMCVGIDIGEIEIKELSKMNISGDNLINSIKHIVDGYFIGIEVSEIVYGLNLSDKINEMFQEICDKVIIILDSIF